jgi:hypothetical protein
MPANTRGVRAELGLIGKPLDEYPLGHGQDVVQ